MYFLVYIKHVYTVFVYHLSIDIMLRKPLQDVTETVLTIIVLTERMLAEWGGKNHVNRPWALDELLFSTKADRTSLGLYNIVIPNSANQKTARPLRERKASAGKTVRPFTSSHFSSLAYSRPFL